MLLRALLVFGWIGIVSFGGGLAAVPEMHRQLVDARAWLTEGDFADGFAFGQLAPGPNMLSVVFYGYRVAGFWGGVLAPVAAFGPGALASGALARAWSALSERPVIVRVRGGLLPVGAGLIAAGVFVLAGETVGSSGAALLLLLVVVAVERKIVQSPVAVVAAGALGALFEL